MKNLAPYLFREWLKYFTDNGLTPVAVVNRAYPGVLLHPELPNVLYVNERNTKAGELGLACDAGLLKFFLPWPSFILSSKEDPTLEVWFSVSTVLEQPKSVPPHLTLLEGLK